MLGRMRSVRVVVRGRVQGVGFRWFVRDAATAHAVTGWVRNLRDGAVEAELHGPDAAVQRVLDAIARGPAGSRVDEVHAADAASDVKVSPAASTFFEIRRTV